MKQILLVLITVMLAGHSSGQDNRIIVPPIGGWKADPAFFATINDSIRLQAVSLWIESVKYEAWEARNQGLKFEITESPKAIRQYAIPAFYGLFGKKFQELTPEERGVIAQTLRQCQATPQIINSLAAVLEDKTPGSPLLKEWTGMFINPPAPARSLIMLGNPDCSLKTATAETYFYQQPENILRVELLTTASAANMPENTRRNKKVYSSLLFTTGNGEVLRSVTGKAELSIQHPQSADSVTSRQSLLLDLTGKTGTVYAFLRTYSYSWRITGNKITWYEKPPQPVIKPIETSLDRIAKNLILNDSKSLPVADLPAGGQETRQGWVSLRIQ